MLGSSQLAWCFDQMRSSLIYRQPKNSLELTKVPYISGILQKLLDIDYVQIFTRLVQNSLNSSTLFPFLPFQYRDVWTSLGFSRTFNVPPPIYPNAPVSCLVVEKPPQHWYACVCVLLQIKNKLANFRCTKAIY